MDSPEMKSFYQNIVEGYLEKQSEAYLYQAAQFGRRLMREEVYPETIIELHDETVYGVVEDYPIEKQLEAIKRSEVLLMEIMMSHSLESREQFQKRKQAEQRLKHINAVLVTIREINQLIVREKDADLLIQKVCNMLIKNRSYRNAWIVLFDEAGDVTITAEAGLGKRFATLQEFFMRGELPACGKMALTQPGLVSIEAPMSDCEHCPSVQNYRGQGVLCVRLQHNSRLYGLLYVSLPVHLTADSEEQGLFSEVADDVAYALWGIEADAQRRQNEEKIKTYSQQLELLVEERTKALREAQEELILKERLAVLGQLAGGVAHELRHPLSVISNIAFLLKAQVSPLDEDTTESLTTLDEEVHRANGIITDLLEFARTNEVARSATSLSELVADVMINHPAPDGITSDIHIPEDLPPAFVDQGHIRQVLTNLIQNAYDAMPDGGRLSISGELRNKSVVHSSKSNGEIRDSEVENICEDILAEEHILIEVTDTGSGIAPENSSKIFEPLFTTKEWGIGLGLAISKSLIDANSGCINFESEVEKGSTFRLLLPVSCEMENL